MCGRDALGGAVVVGAAQLSVGGEDVPELDVGDRSGLCGGDAGVGVQGAHLRPVGVGDLGLGGCGCHPQHRVGVGILLHHRFTSVH